MSAAERAYRLLLRAYPAAFRSEYEREMLILFREQLRDARGREASFWVAALSDVARSAPALRVDGLRARWNGTAHLEGGIMKSMAILAVLVGALEVVNALAEGWYGGVIGHDGRSLVAGTIAAVGGVLLAIAGITLLRGAPRSLATAHAAGLACLAAFAIVGVAAPRLSMLSMLLGIAVPTALLSFLNRSGGRGASKVMTT